MGLFFSLFSAFFCRVVNQILQQQLELVLVVLTGKNFFYYTVSYVYLFLKVFSSMHDCYFQFSVEVCCPVDVK